MSRLSFLLAVLGALLCHLTSAFLPMRTALPSVSRAALQPRSSSPAGRRKSVAVMARELWEVRPSAADTCLRPLARLLP